MIMPCAGIMKTAIQEKFDDALKQILPEKGRVLLAVSGGVDSIVMAELFMHSSLSVPFELAHCNFQLREGDSWSDELFVANWCSGHGIKLHRVTFETTRYAEEHHLSIEMAARDLRYSWFDRLCGEEHFSAVAIAHNANDNAETLFLNLLRGTGIKGICGMHRKAVLPVPGSVHTLIRPLLGITRAEIEDYAQEQGIPYCIDRTNAETEYKRNRIRNLVFPQLVQINPSFLSTLAADMERFAQIDAVADAYFEEHRPELLSKTDGLSSSPISGRQILEIDIESLMKQEQQGYMLFRLLEPYGFNTTSIENILRTVRSEKTISGKVFHSEGYKLFTSGKKLSLIENEKVDDENEGSGVGRSTPSEKVINNNSEIVDNFSSLVVEGEGAYELNGRRFHVRLMDRTPDLNLWQPEGILLWDYDKLSFPFLMRGWQKGDWFRPLGLQGLKKLSDFFTDRKFSLLQKQEAVVVQPLQNTDSHELGHVLSVLCLRIDESVKVTSRTRRVVIVQEER